MDTIVSKGTISIVPILRSGKRGEILLKKKIVYALLVTVCLFSIGGCAKKEKSVQEEHNWDISKVPSHVQEDINENLKIDADVRIGDGFEKGKADIFQITEKKLDTKKAEELLLKGKTVDKKEVKEDETVYTLAGEDEARVSIYDDWFYYGGKLAESIGYSFRYEYADRDNNINEYLKREQDFPFMSMEEAKEKSLTLMNELGGEWTEDAIRSFRLDHETLKKEEKIAVIDTLPEEEQSKPRENWTEKDDSYYFEFAPVIEGYELIEKYEIPDSEQYLGIVNCRVICNADGLVETYRGDVFEVRKRLEEQKSLLELEAVLEKLREKYSKVMLQEQLKVVEIRLGNICKREQEKGIYETVPVWDFKVVAHDEETIWGYDIVFDAITGEELH